MAQVKRLISRDRKEFLGNKEDILDKYTEEFGVGTPEDRPADRPAESRSTGEDVHATPHAWHIACMRNSRGDQQ